MESFVYDQVKRCIYGSNRIAGQGGSLEETKTICQKLLTCQLEPDVSETRAQHSILQHAKAFMYLHHMLVVENVPLSEEILLRTHSVLTLYYKEAGIYRTDDIFPSTEAKETVATGKEAFKMIKDALMLPAITPGDGVPASSSEFEDTCSFVKGELVRGYMNRLVTSYNSAIRLSNYPKIGLVRTVDIATRYSSILMSIRPFKTGSGRMGRILMNVTLLKHINCVAVMGINEKEIKWYKELAIHSNKVFYEEERLGAPWGVQTCHFAPDELPIGTPSLASWATHKVSVMYASQQ